MRKVYVVQRRDPHRKQWDVLAVVNSMKVVEELIRQHLTLWR
jgi:hypothetical protein